MNLPFTTEEFFLLFGKYNSGIFPVQIIFYILALTVIYLLLRKQNYSLIISSILAFFWLWMGVVYHIIYFSQINPAAYIFGGLFIIQGLVFLYSGLLKKNLVFSYSNDVYTIAGWIIIAYGLVLYPFIGYLVGHHYPFAPELSAPCPTTIFTFGTLLFTSKISKWIVVIPLVWAMIAFLAAINLTVPQDYGLIIAGIICTAMVTYRSIKYKIKFV